MKVSVGEWDFWIFFAKSVKEEGGKKGVQKIAENISYVRRDAFVDDLLFL